jgi:hypothetical protein
MSVLCYLAGSLATSGLSERSRAMTHPYGDPADALWDAFELDDETAEPQPEPGDFWGEMDNDSDSNG